MPSGNVGTENEQVNMENEKLGDKEGEGFIDARKQKKKGVGHIGKKEQRKFVKQKLVFRPIDKQTVEKAQVESNNSVMDETTQEREKPKSPMKSWNVQKDVIDELRKSANKYAVLDVVFKETSRNDMSKESVETVDEFIRKKTQPTFEVTAKWSQVMRKYFKDQWEMKVQCRNVEVDDVFDD